MMCCSLENVALATRHGWPAYNIEKFPLPIYYTPAARKLSDGNI